LTNSAAAKDRSHYITSQHFKPRSKIQSHSVPELGFWSEQNLYDELDVCHAHLFTFMYVYLLYVKLGKNVSMQLLCNVWQSFNEL